MSFDLGGFLGGLIGVIGAVVVARLSFKWELNKSNPERLRNAYETAEKFHMLLANYLVDLILVDSSSTKFDVIKRMQKFLNDFSPLFNACVEYDAELAKIAVKIKEAVDATLKGKIDETPDQWLHPDTNVDAIQIADDMKQAITVSMSQLTGLLLGVAKYIAETDSGDSILKQFRDKQS